MKVKKWFSAWLCLCLVLVFAPASLTAQAAGGPSITTTLTDNAIQRGSKKTFDVWARNASGSKIKATVRLNGEKLTPTWDDNEKASYTLIFTREGENVVTVSASSDGGRKRELTYHIIYQKAGEGEQIGTAIWTVEAFTLGCGYLVAPTEVAIYEGETAAEQLIRLLHTSGFVGYYGGNVKNAFYLAYIADGTAAGERYNGYQKSGTPDKPRTLSLSPVVPTLLVPYLQESMTYFDPDDYSVNCNGYLGEFAVTNGSGWMYCVNNVFPNVGFADCYPADGDVVRVQFTLGYGADIGGFGAMGTEIPDVDTQPSGGYFTVANKDALTRNIARARTSGVLARANVATAYRAALDAAAMLNASQETADAAAAALERAVAAPDAPSADDKPPVEEVPPVITTAPVRVTTRASGRATTAPFADSGKAADGAGLNSETADAASNGETVAAVPDNATQTNEAGETALTPTETNGTRTTDDACVLDGEGESGGKRRTDATDADETVSDVPSTVTVLLWTGIVTATAAVTALAVRQYRRHTVKHGEDDRTDE